MPPAVMTTRRNPTPGMIMLRTIMATVIYGAFFIVLANAVVDIGYAWLDPRIRPT